MLFRSALILTAVLSTPAMAGELASFSVEPYVVVVPTEHFLTVAADAAEATPDCASILTDLRRNRRNIERCTGSAAAIPDAYCNLFKEDLIRDLKGIINSRFDTREPDVEQTFSLRVDPAAVQAGDLAEFARAQGYALGAVVAGRVQFQVLEGIDIDVKSDSYTALLQRAETLGWAPEFRISQGKLETRDRLTYCELMSGALTVSGTGDFTVNYDLPIERHRLEDYYRLYEELKEIDETDQYRSHQKFLLAGWSIGSFMERSGSGVQDTARLLELGNLFYKRSRDEIQLNAFGDPFAIGSQLPKETLSREAQLGLIAGR